MLQTYLRAHNSMIAQNAKHTNSTQQVLLAVRKADSTRLHLGLAGLHLCVCAVATQFVPLQPIQLP